VVAEKGRKTVVVDSSAMYVDVACCCRRLSQHGLSVMILNPAKLAEPIEMLFRLWTVDQGAMY